MPFSGFDDWDDCIATMTDEEGHSQEAAENICGALQAEAKADNGDPDALMDALREGAGLIADVGVDLVSGVDVPAVDSKWVMMKSGEGRDGHDYRAVTPVLLAKEDDEDDEDGPDRRISYAAAMIPREPDKEGDVVPTPTVERAAHDFLKSDGGVDTDHSLIDGEGQPVESWVLKEPRTFDLPDGGGEETYPAGTWMLGIEWGADAWERIESGELTGLSIYGMADHVPLSRAAACNPGLAKQLDIPLATESVVHLVYESRTAAEKASEEIGLDGAVHEHTFDGMDVWMPGATHEEFVDTYMDLSEAADDGETVAAGLSDAKADSGDTGKRQDSENGDMGDQTDSDGGDAGTDDATGDGGGPTLKDVTGELNDLAESVAAVKEAVETEKQDEQEALAMLADAHGMDPGDVSDLLTLVEGKDLDQVLDAIDSVEANDAPADDAAKEDDMDDDDEDEEDKSVEKRAGEANLGKGGDGRQTAAKGIDSDGGASSGLPSYQAVAEQAEDD
jgi:hypothetical protein